ncbi:hypothetical protein TNCT_505421 [Trichonephila clavata]|uniref:Uncharacterized protein n=1 Tax=Trichonephila clavata TaxID=2740835 RepID=A0A8X6JMQ0_TRICU|nr:hypothetical protein TNCT_505421 [Trichonephila clavata]
MDLFGIGEVVVSTSIVVFYLECFKFLDQFMVLLLYSIQFLSYHFINGESSKLTLADALEQREFKLPSKDTEITLLTRLDYWDDKYSFRRIIKLFHSCFLLSP